MFGLSSVWGLIGIPLVVTIVLLIGWRKRLVWWELVLPWAVTLLIIPIAQFSAEKIAVNDDEFWGYLGVKTYWNEPFQYWDTCSEQYACGTYKCGNSTCTRYCTRYYPCKQWGGNDAYLFNRAGDPLRISPAKFKELVSRGWPSEEVELHREREYDIIQDGDRQVAIWPEGDWLKSEPIVEKHTYENRVQASTTVRFRKVDEKTKKAMGLFDYPYVSAGWEMVTVLDNSGRHWRAADKRFRFLNGEYGPLRKMRLWVLIFKGQGREAAGWQKDYWKNGNKNEFIICIGTDENYKIRWGEVISWTEMEELKIEYRDYVEQRMEEVNEQTLLELAGQVENDLCTRYVKPDFTEKWKHLSVNPSATVMIVVFVIIVAVNGGVAAFVVLNRFHSNDETGQTSVGKVKSPFRRHLGNRSPAGLSKTSTRKKKTSRPSGKKSGRRNRYRR